MEAPSEGSTAPRFTLQEVEGETISLEDFRGQVVLLNFWATWCGPCRFEMPAIQDRFTTYDFAVLAVNFDEPADMVREYGQELDLTFPLLLDPGGKVQQLYQVRGYPTTIFVDEEGIVRIVHIGVMTEGQLDGHLSELGVLN